MSDAGFDVTEPKTRLIAVLAAVTVIALVALVLGVQAYFDYAREEQVFIKVLAPDSEDLVNLRAREDEELNSYRFIDRAQGKVRLPIDRAMDLLAAEYAAGKLPYSTRRAPVKPAQPPREPAR